MTNRQMAQLSFEMDELDIQIPRLADWDCILLNSSGGKDSQTMVREVVRIADEQEVSRERLVVVHAELGRVEWPGAMELAKEHAEHYGLRFEKVKRDLGDLLEQVEKRGKWPASHARYCTSDHKRAQIQKVMTSLAPAPKKHEPIVNVLNCLGIRAEESSARRKKLPFERNKQYDRIAKRRNVYDWHPILDWTEEEVWENIRESGMRYHWAYDLGMPRLSCRFCIFAPKAALILAGKHNPELLADYVAVEERIGHTGFVQNFKHAQECTLEITICTKSGVAAGRANRLSTRHSLEQYVVAARAVRGCC